MARKILNGFLILFTMAVLLNVLVYTGFTKDEAHLANKPAELKASLFYMTMFYSHIFIGAIALITAVIQLTFTLRKLKSHRIVGKTYLLAVLVSGTSGLYIAYHSSTGIVAQIGFSCLAVLWLFTSYMAYYHIRLRNIILHQKWIMRSLALTFAAITLRILLPTAIISGLSFNESYPIIAWACWVPNLLINELINKEKKIEFKVA